MDSGDAHALLLRQAACVNRLCSTMQDKTGDRGESPVRRRGCGTAFAQHARLVAARIGQIRRALRPAAPARRHHGHRLRGAAAARLVGRQPPRHHPGHLPPATPRRPPCAPIAPLPAACATSTTRPGFRAATSACLRSRSCRHCGFACWMQGCSHCRRCAATRRRVRVDPHRRGALREVRRSSQAAPAVAAQPQNGRPT